MEVSLTEEHHSLTGSGCDEWLADNSRAGFDQIRLRFIKKVQKSTELLNRRGVRERVKEL